MRTSHAPRCAKSNGFGRCAGREVGGYGGGVLSASVEMIHRDLQAYGEAQVADWMLACSDEELVRVCSVAQWLLYHGPSQPTGASMMLAKACALAAVYVCEGRPRDLARSRRIKVKDQLPVPTMGRRPDYVLQNRLGHEYGVGDDARSFWSAP